MEYFEVLKQNIVFQTEEKVAWIWEEVDRDHIGGDHYHSRNILDQVQKIYVGIIITLDGITAYYGTFDGDSQNKYVSDPISNYFIQIVVVDNNRKDDGGAITDENGNPKF